MSRRNWAGTYEYTAPTLVRPSSVDDVRRAVVGARRVHALGTRHSFTDLPDTDGTLVDVGGLAPTFRLDAQAREVTVSAATRYGDVASTLDERGWALANLGSLPHIGVAGATATGTHGSGDGNGVLTTSVRMLRYVGADGDVHEVRRGDDDFPALAVGLGAYGVVLEVGLDIVPSYRVRQDVYAGMRWEALLSDVPAVTGAGYSVSVFTRWEPGAVGDVWVKRRLEDDAETVPGELLDAARADASAFEEVLGDNRTALSEPGPWMLRLPHFRLDAEPSFGHEIQSEYFVPRSAAADALDALRPLGAALRPHLVVTELRTAAADDLWLSPASGQDVFIVHFTWYDHPDEVWELLPRIEDALEPFGARPHWGKVHRFDAERMAAVHPRLHQAREVFERLDPDGRFVNDHLVRVGARAPR